MANSRHHISGFTEAHHTLGLPTSTNSTNLLGRRCIKRLNHRHGIVYEEEEDQDRLHLGYS